jgi:hypothetical protein
MAANAPPMAVARAPTGMVKNFAEVVPTLVTSWPLTGMTHAARINKNADLEIESLFIWMLLMFVVTPSGDEVRHCPAPKDFLSKVKSFFENFCVLALLFENLFSQINSRA